MLTIILDTLSKTHFQPITRNPDGKLSFHSLQDAINVYRRCRIQRLRLSYPPLQPKKRSTHMNATMWLESTTNTHLDVSSSLKHDLSNSGLTIVDCNDRLLQSILKQKVRGLSKAEIFEKVGKSFMQLHT